MKNILLISPDSDNEGLWITGEESAEVLNNMVPLGLATIAALTSGEYRVVIHDELVHGLITHDTDIAATYDLVGITGFKTHLPRCREIASIVRDQGIPVCIGGPGVSGTPDAYRGSFDVLFIGEAEFTWPRFLRDFETGDYKGEYRQIEKLDLSQSPMPKWESIVGDFGKYTMGCVQTTRGCPFDCEFCDVIYLYGRRSRHKPIERVLEEVRTMDRLGMHSVFFCDDEFIGDPKYAKKLLRELIVLNRSFETPQTYSTQLTMNLSKDNEMLELMADAGFNLVFIGIESPNIESLRETGKFQNIRKDLVADVRKILSYGIAIRAGAIVGFDSDGLDIFDIQREFIQKTCLPSLAINMLKAPLGTKLWSRLRQQGRVITLVKLKDQLGHARSYTNVLPAKMSRIELMEGYKRLLQDVHSWDAFRDRVIGFVSGVERAPQVNEPQPTFEEAVETCMVPSVPESRRGDIESMLRHTLDTAPFMLRRVKIIIVQFVKYLETLEKLYPQLDRQIDLERSGQFPLDPDDRPITVPPAFRLAFPKIFPDVHRRVYVNLGNKEEVPRVLTEVFVDFLVRWGEGYKEPEEHHKTFLQEICDRTCAAANGQTPQDYVPKESDDAPIPDIKRARLADDILKTVEQELFEYVVSQGTA